MKTLHLVRHAKSSWAEAGLDDFDRPLNERGKKDAPDMARRLVKKGLTIDLLVSSPAKRAKKTASIFAEELGLSQNEILYIPQLYLADTSIFGQVIGSINNKFNSIIIFSHNPGITAFANSLTNVKIDDMPTCSVFSVSSESKDWTQFMVSDKTFLFFDFPKLGS